MPHTHTTQLWDIAGQESFRAMTRTYFRGASGCVILFDVTDRNTFEHTRDWKADLDSKVVLPNGEPIPCILLANKVSLCICVSVISSMANIMLGIVGWSCGWCNLVNCLAKLKLIYIPFVSK